MKKYRVMDQAIAPFEDGENKGKHYYPGSPHGDVVELNDGDPRVAIWLEDGVITPEHSHKEPKLKEDKPESKGEGR